MRIAQFCIDNLSDTVNLHLIELALIIAISSDFAHTNLPALLCFRQFYIVRALIATRGFGFDAGIKYRHIAVAIGLQVNCISNFGANNVKFVSGFAESRPRYIDVGAR